MEEEEDDRKEKERAKNERIWSWGAGSDAQLGTATVQDHSLPHLLPLPPFSSLACGGAHVLALTSGTHLHSPTFISNTVLIHSWEN